MTGQRRSEPAPNGISSRMGASREKESCSIGWPRRGRSIVEVAGPPDEEIEAAVISGPIVHDGTIRLVEFDDAWAQQFARVAERIRAALGGVAVQVEHVGSTSVPGLAAKPIIDIVLAVPDSSDEAAYVPALEAAGYVLRIREPNWFEHRLFKGPDTDVNVHVFSAGCSEIDRMVWFRDHLRSDRTDRELYERTKRELAARRWKYVQHYANAKSDVVAEIMTRAEPQPCVRTTSPLETNGTTDHKEP
jgi:GrpB-like predicted nucleotidyltransferase (UPF0157 family)